jgi:hypothetical protein
MECAAAEMDCSLGAWKALKRVLAEGHRAIPRHIYEPQETHTGLRVTVHLQRWIIGPGVSVMDAQVGRSRAFFYVGLAVVTLVYSAAVLTVKYLLM